MKRFILFPVQIIAFVVIISLSSCSKKQDGVFFKRNLDKGWFIQNSEQVNAEGETISKTGFDTKNWYPAKVPQTVMHCLTDNGVYTNIYMDDNLEKIPTKQFNSPWWYRTVFKLEKVPSGILLDFKGINYKANIWLNGKLIADTSQVVNSFRQFKFNISKYAVTGENVLAVEVFPPVAGDFTIGFVDWNPAPPDKNMGIFRKVYLEVNEGIGISDPYVVSDLNNDLTEAALRASVIVTNYCEVKYSGDVAMTLNGKKMIMPVTILPGESQQVLFVPETFEALKISDPKLWWPHTLGDPHLYTAGFEFRAGGKTFDAKNVEFGIRTVSDYFTEDGHRGFKINGKKIMIRGGGWVDRLLLYDTYNNTEAQLEYVKDMNLNTIRLEGFWGKDQTFDWPISLIFLNWFPGGYKNISPFLSIGGGLNYLKYQVRR